MTTTDLRALLGDRYVEARRAALRALLTAELHGDPGENVVDLLIDCGPRSDYVLAAVLPDLLAAAWDEGADFVARHPGMSAEYVRAANPYRTTATAAHCDRGPCHLPGEHGGPCNPGDDASTEETR